MHAMWKPQKFKYIYLYATVYVFTLTLPSAIAVYWAFGDQLLDHSNAFSLLPRSGWRDTGVILMLIHQVHICISLPHYLVQNQDYYMFLVSTNFHVMEFSIYNKELIKLASMSRED